MPELPEALREQEIEDTHKLSVERKLEIGAELFDQACQVMLWGIHAHFPGTSDEDAHRILRGRLDLGRRLETTVVDL